MELSGMNKMSEDNHIGLVGTTSSCPVHLLNKLQCSSAVEHNTQSGSLSPSVNVLVEGFNCSYVEDVTRITTKASMITQLESNRTPLFADEPNAVNDSSGTVLSGMCDGTSDVCASEKREPPTHSEPFKSPIVQYNQDLETTVHINNVAASSVLCSSSASISTFFPSESLQCNGSSQSSVTPVSDCHTPTTDHVHDINGDSNSYTPAYMNDADRVRMDLTKLDETIDYVLACARTDEPCEGMFVLPCRLRETTHLSSPNVRANTPSSSLLASPSPSPTPSSPHSGQISSSPMLNSTSKAHSLLQPSNIPTFISTHSLPRYVVDPNTGLFQLSSAGVNPQCFSAQRTNNQAVPYLNIYSDSVNPNRVQAMENPFMCQMRQPLTTNTQVVFHPTLHSFHNHSVHQTNHFTLPQSPLSTSPLHRTYNSLLSPTKINLVHPAGAQMVKQDSLSPTLTRNVLTYPADVTLQQTGRTMVFSSPTTVCVVSDSVQRNTSAQSIPVTPLPVEFVSDSSRTSNCSASVLDNSGSSHLSTPFRQPIVPAQPMNSCISTSNLSSTAPVFSETTTSLISTAPFVTSRTQSVSHIPCSRKRSSTNAPVSTKRRRTSVPASSCSLVGKGLSVDQRGALSVAHENFEKLKFSDIKTLVSAPRLRPYVTVLPPVGSADPPSQMPSESDDELLMRNKGLKYTRGPFALRVPKCFYPNTSGDQVDQYIVQNLQAVTPQSPLVRKPRPISHAGDTVSVCASPEPISFENRMMTLFSSMRRSPKQDRTRDKNAQFNASEQTGTMPSSISQLLPMFSEATPTSGKPDPERCSPPLPLFHMPNPRLLCEPIRITSNELVEESDQKPVGPPQLLENISIIDNVPTKTVAMCNSATTMHSPLIDSETGEVVAGHRHCLPLSSVQNLDAPTFGENDKLHITFTINPSMTGGVSKIISRIADLLGIDRDSVCYQVTRSGAQIILDQKQSQSESLMRNLESHLREQFTPLSLHFEKGSVTKEQSTISEKLSSTPLPTSVSESLQSANLFPDSTVFHPQTKNPVGSTGSTKIDFVTGSNAEYPKYLEEPVSIVSLLANKRGVAKPCQNCDKLVPPHFGYRKCLEDLASLTGLSSRSDITDDFVFCSNECLLQFTRSVSCRRLHSFDSDNSHPTTANSCTGDSRQPTLVCDLSASMPVLLQNSTPKLLKTAKRQLSTPQSQGPNAKRRTTSGSSKTKKWRGIRWRPFSSDMLPTSKFSSPKSLGKRDIEQLLLTHSPCLRLPASDDHRQCTLCKLRGDNPEKGLGRLLPYDVDKWLHINCALWCYEVYETVGGSLNNVDVWLKKALATTCTHCGQLGAGLPCYNPRCTYCYHVPCAINVGCMFFTDRGMYCPQHQPKESHPMQLPSLAVNRRVYIARDENAEVGSVIHEEDRLNVLRIGTVCLLNVGQLLPHQIESGLFHTRRYIYPVGFRTSRCYWSMRKRHSRARYLCEILEQDGKPLFRVTVQENGMDDETFVDTTCSGVWNSILSKIEKLREQNGLVRLFPQHLKGEDLYGLSEPHIVRAVESLPGMDCLRDYAFNFGRMELIAEMPLAINPSGCARCEPKMQTYLKRFRANSENSSNSTSRSVSGFRRSTHPSLSRSALMDNSSKQYLSSRSQQYRRLKVEVASNVILGRSRIQGLGLFAARPLEPQTMVIEYIGELIRLELANKREKEYEAHNRGIYMFRLNDDTVIDATVCGGLARYVNHSCQPNCYAEFLNFSDHSHIVIITNSHIDKGAELCYDYNFDLEDGGSKIPCLCRAPNCRKWMN